jgi:hypothetical protein
MAERLQKEWFYRYLQSPQSLSPRTVMPTFWPGGKAIRQDILDGQAEQQIEAIWQYLQEGRQARTPRGLVQEPIELLAGDEAVMLRRSYQGIGKRGIGVGYPRGVNLAFDAEQMRLAMIWKGKFAEAGGVWRGQGSGTVRPLGSELIRFDQAPELGKTPWLPIAPDSRPATHQFRGYYLDEQRRPIFTYQFDGVEIEDYLTDATDDTGAGYLIRTLTFQSKQEQAGLFFRLATSPGIEQVDAQTFRIDGGLTVTLDEQHSAQTVKAPTGQSLVVPLNIPVGKTQLVITYRW